ncbi:hypothetical protein [Campylobacter hyointestinalis]|uniref:hypothetical protein n=1 Tax=Campylobacter hyointestinalis TaxID=198 RepID=UPI0015EC7C15|nr:hypothetical protein [Campylobacter hyointestinalis]
MSGIRRVVLAIIRRISYLFKAYVLRDKFLLAHIRWVKDRGDETLRLEYALDRNSIVIDGGGYKGDFSKNIFDRYGSKIFIFEPVSKYADDINCFLKIINRFLFLNADFQIKMAQCKYHYKMMHHLHF